MKSQNNDLKFCKVIDVKRPEAVTESKMSFRVQENRKVRE